MLRNGNRQYGYSLLEVLVAFALLAAALSVLLGARSTAARQVGRAEDEGRARLHAQSLLAGLGIDTMAQARPLQVGDLCMVGKDLRLLLHPATP